MRRKTGGEIEKQEDPAGMGNKNRYETRILNRLLDQYENSRLSTGENQRTIHIEFPFRKKEIPEYFDESSGEYETIHILMQELEKKGWIRIFWKNGKIGHVIEKVRLELEDGETAAPEPGDGETASPEMEDGKTSRPEKGDCETTRLETVNSGTARHSMPASTYPPGTKNHGHTVLREIYRYLGRKPLADMEEETIQVLKQFLIETRRERAGCVQGQRDDQEQSADQKQIADQGQSANRRQSADQKQIADQGQSANRRQSADQEQSSDQLRNPDLDQRQDMMPGKDRNPAPSVRFAEYLLDRISRHQSVKEYVDLAKPDSTDKFLHALRYVEENKDSCYIREFSILHFHDSKYFEQIERQVAGVLRKFWSQAPDVCDGIETPDPLLPIDAFSKLDTLFRKDALPGSVHLQPVDSSSDSEYFPSTDYFSNLNGVAFTEPLSNSYIRNPLIGANLLEGMDTAEIMAEYGIYHTPNYVYLKGNVTICLKVCAESCGKSGKEKNKDSENTCLDLSLLHQGIGISGEDLPRLRFMSLSGIQKVLTIENLTTFFRWQEADTLIIYLGGYHNGVRRSLLKNIYRYIPGASYLHFGDLDAGGFSILEDLKRKTGIMFRPYHMDRETFEKYQNYAKPLTASDRKRLELLARNPEYEDVIQCMLEAGKKLEQECIQCVNGGSSW